MTKRVPHWRGEDGHSCRHRAPLPPTACRRHFIFLQVAALGLVIAAAAQAVAAAVEEPRDDDCELAELTATRRGHRAVVDWPALRDAMSRGSREVVSPLLQQVRQNSKEAAFQCPIGYAAVCLVGARVPEINACIKGLSLSRVLASRWPLFEQLAQLQLTLGGSSRSCDDTWHPSLNWTDFRMHTLAFVDKVPPWLLGLSEGEDEFNEALTDAQGVVWKASSSAVAYGRTIADWSSDCELGLVAANAVRAAGIVIGDGDVYRIVQRALESLERVFDRSAEMIETPWPFFGLLHTLSLMKKTLHDVRLPLDDLTPLTPTMEVQKEDGRSPVWRAAAAALRRAAGDAGIILMTALQHFRIDFLQPLLKRADRLGFLRALTIVPLLVNVTASCDEISEIIVMVRQLDDMPPGWSACLPFVSQFQSRAQFIYIQIALHLDITVLWFDFHVFWVQSPLPWLAEVLRQPTPPAYYDPCSRKCPPAGPIDMFVVDEFYVSSWPKTTLLLLRPTEAMLRWSRMLLHWLWTYPFAIAKRGLHYMLHPDKPDAVPSMSMLPPADRVPRLALAELDAEQRFVGTDGWVGRADLIISFEVGAGLIESDRVFILDRLYAGSEVEVLQTLRPMQKMLSPLRPTERGREGVETCSWQYATGAYLGGYADDIEDTFASQHLAQCECLALGPGCRGVTCEPVDTAGIAREEYVGSALKGKGEGEGGGLSCTLRRGEEPFLAASPVGEESYIKVCAGGGGGCNAREVLRVVHVNFADGCCETEQKQSSETSLSFGADESRPLRGNFLDRQFRRRNHHLLKFNRTPELTQHKTPTGKIGYYVWKPYVVLRTVEDPALPWDTTVVAWTDAGIHFVGDMRPLIDRYLRASDVAATRTPMLEGDFSKRDAFILLDADYGGIIETNQVATGFILVRKTRLAVEFLQRWLAACEDPRIMTEEPSVLGVPDYFTFRNNNDDQTAFSLLFKRYGFHAFSVGERDSVVYTGRNLAKFIKVSDDFAVGREGGQDDYLKAADEAAAISAAGAN